MEIISIVLTHLTISEVH